MIAAHGHVLVSPATWRLHLGNFTLPAARFKVYLQGSVAEVTYTEPLRIPGKLLTPSTNPVDTALLITELRQHMAHLRPVPAAQHTSPATFVYSSLEKCTHVFLRQDTKRRALEPPYSGPYQVLSWRCCNYSYAGGLSPCQPTGSSQPATSTGTTARTTPTHQP
jgi:hypothetical protein